MRVPGLSPSHTATSASATEAICALRTWPADLPRVAQSAGYRSTGRPRDAAHRSPSRSAPGALPLMTTDGDHGQLAIAASTSAMRTSVRLPAMMVRNGVLLICGRWRGLLDPAQGGSGSHSQQLDRGFLQGLAGAIPVAVPPLTNGQGRTPGLRPFTNHTPFVCGSRMLNASSTWQGSARTSCTHIVSRRFAISDASHKSRRITLRAQPSDGSPSGQRACPWGRC